MVHGHLDYFEIPSLGGRPNIKPGDHDTTVDLLYFIICADPG